MNRAYYKFTYCIRKCLTHTLSDLNDLTTGSFEENISRLDGSFTRDLINLLDRLYEFSGQTVSGMVSRLDFNGFYQQHVKSHDITIVT